jgi:hypothetical protein
MSNSVLIAAIITRFPLIIDTSDWRSSRLAITLGATYDFLDCLYLIVSLKNTLNNQVFVNSVRKLKCFPRKIEIANAIDQRNQWYLYSSVRGDSSVRILNGYRPEGRLSAGTRYRA